MKRLILLIICISLIICNAETQNLIALQNGSTPTFYSSLDTTVAYAQSGDTIYITGGYYNCNIQIDKELHLIGVGHDIDSSSLTHPTFINGSITLTSGSSNSSFDGIRFSNFGCSWDTINVDVDNIKLTRCYCSEIRFSGQSTNWILKENIITGNVWGRCVNYGPYATNNLISNNIFTSYIYGFGENNLFFNNVFTNSSGGAFFSCTFRNNIFIGSLSCIASGFNVNNEFNIVDNNLFDGTLNLGLSNTGVNNISGQNMGSIFNNVTTLLSTNFNYADDYHLQNNCPGINAGTDGTDIGIYGGLYPWKDGSIPFNPHVQQKTVSGTTDNNGNLNVNIKVEAQDY